MVIIISAKDIPYQLPGKFHYRGKERKIPLLPVFGFAVTAVVALQACKAHLYPGSQEMIDRFFCKQGKAGLYGSERTERIGCQIALVNIHTRIDAHAHIFIKLGMAFTGNK